MSEKTLQQIVSMLSDTMVRFDKLEERFDKLEERFDKLEERFDKLEERHNTLEKNMNTQFAEQNKELRVITEQVGRNKELLTVHSNQMNKLTEDIGRIDLKSNDTISKLKMLDGKMDGRDSDIVVLNNRLFKLESTVQKLVN
jgi:chromosome segregation ATPase